MTTTEMRIAIAEKCGWELDTTPDTKHLGYLVFHRHVSGKGYQMVNYREDDLPYYLSDLNAMHEAILAQPEHIQWAIFAELAILVPAEKPAYLGTAAQYAEAFCRTLWPEKF